MAKAKSKMVNTDVKDKTKALEMAMKQITKDFGEGSIMKLGENLNMNVEVIPTGSITLDIALGQGGVPRGRIIEIYGAESSGKTTLALHVAAEAQKTGGIVAFIDAEHALDPEYAKALGVDVDELLISQPDYGEQALEIADMLVRSGAIDLIVVDSVAALVPKTEIDGEMSDQQMGLQARLMSKALRSGPRRSSVNARLGLCVPCLQPRVSCRCTGLSPWEPPHSVLGAVTAARPPTAWEAGAVDLEGLIPIPDPDLPSLVPSL